MLPLALPSNPVGGAVKHKMGDMHDSPVWLLYISIPPIEP